MPSSRTDALRTVIDATRHLFHRLANAADAAHADLGVTASQRAVLEALARDGAQSVPQIARAKGVSRQHIQMIVNSLSAAGLVDARDNPAHQRSPLLVLTPDGERCFRDIGNREQEILTELAQSFRLGDLEVAAETLRKASDLVDEGRRIARPRKAKQRSRT